MRCGMSKIFVDHALVYAQCLEDLRATVALNGRDAHLGEDLDDAFDGRLDVVADRLFEVEDLKFLSRDHSFQGFQRPSMV